MLYSPGTLTGLLLADSEINLNTKIDTISPAINQSSTAQIDLTLFGLNQNIAVFEQGIIENSASQVNTSKITEHNRRITQVSSSQTAKRSISNNSSSKVYSTEIDPDQTRSISASKIDSTEIGILELSAIKHTFKKTSITQVNPTQVNPTQVNSIGFKPTEISTSSSISTDNLLSKQLQILGIHNSTSQIINGLNNSATNIWSNLLQSEIPLDICDLNHKLAKKEA